MEHQPKHVFLNPKNQPILQKAPTPINISRLEYTGWWGLIKQKQNVQPCNGFKYGITIGYTGKIDIFYQKT